MAKEGRRVLIAGRDVDAVNLLKIVLEREGYEVLCVPGKLDTADAMGRLGNVTSSKDLTHAIVVSSKDMDIAEKLNKNLRIPRNRIGIWTGVVARVKDTGYTALRKESYNLSASYDGIIQFLERS